MNSLAIFDNKLTGHHIEYIHNLYIGATRFDNKYFYFIVPNGFTILAQELVWPEKENIKILELSKSQTSWIQKRPTIASIAVGLVLNSFRKKYGIKEFFFISLMDCLPLSHILLRKVNISGIIYFIYLYRWEKSTFLTKILDVAKYKTFVLNKKFRYIYILNDSSSATYFNKIYNTSKFKYLNDPFVAHSSRSYNIRQKYQISNDKKIVLHFGSMSRRKSTLDVMDSMNFLSEEEKNSCVFIFAGKVNKDIHDLFYEKLEVNRANGCCIIVEDTFCSYDFIESCCYSCDTILAPYSLSGQSSGVIGYAAFYKKPVVGPNDGLIGKLIRKYSLGIGVDINPKSIYEGIIQSFSFCVTESDYNKLISVVLFQEIILSS